jgi:hypothetical protein
MRLKRIRFHLRLKLMQNIIQAEISAVHIYKMLHATCLFKLGHFRYFFAEFVKLIKKFTFAKIKATVDIRHSEQADHLLILGVEKFHLPYDPANWLK